jgi:hypothetical protein
MKIKRIQGGQINNEFLTSEIDLAVDEASKE